MSKFSTVLSVPVAEILTKLPKGSHVHAITLSEDKSGVEIVWDNNHLQTAYTFATPFPVEHLNGESLPTGVKLTLPIVVKSVETSEKPQLLTIKVDKKKKKSDTDTQ